MTSTENADNASLFARIFGRLKKRSQFVEEFESSIKVNSHFLIDAFAIIIESSKDCDETGTGSNITLANYSVGCEQH